MANKGMLLLVGTAKGLFLLKREAGSDKWDLDGPHFAGRAVYSAFYDDRKGRSDLWAGPVSWHFGAELCKSTDMGATWDAPERMRIKMPANTKKSLENIWQIAPGADADTLYAGVAAGSLVRISRPRRNLEAELRPLETSPSQEMDTWIWRPLPAHDRN